MRLLLLAGAAFCACAAATAEDSLLRLADTEELRTRLDELVEGSDEELVSAGLCDAADGTGCRALAIFDVCTELSLRRTGGAHPRNAYAKLYRSLRGRTLALNLFGLLRSLRSTICNFYVRVYGPLVWAGLDVRIFVHTYDHVNGAATQRNADSDGLQAASATDLRLLPVDRVLITDQGAFRGILNATSFLPPRAPRRFAFDEDAYGTPSVLLNLLTQYRSLEEVTRLWRSSGTAFDAVCYLRPDVAWLHAFPVHLVREAIRHRRNGQREILYAPRWAKSRGLNDRFGLGSPRAMEHWALRLAAARRYVAASGRPLHPEQFLGYHMRAHVSGLFLLENAEQRPCDSCVAAPVVVRLAPRRYLTVASEVDEAFVRVRAAGRVARQDCEAFPFLEGQAGDDLFIPRFSLCPLAGARAAAESCWDGLPPPTRRNATCVGGDRDPYPWGRRARFQRTPATESALVLWALRRGWGGRLWATTETHPAGDACAHFLPNASVLERQDQGNGALPFITTCGAVTGGGAA